MQNIFVHKLAIYVHTYESLQLIHLNSQIVAVYMLFSFDRSCAVIYCYKVFLNSVLLLYNFVLWSIGAVWSFVELCYCTTDCCFEDEHLNSAVFSYLLCCIVLCDIVLCFVTLFCVLLNCG